MKLAAVLDISTFLWDRAHHDANRASYYTIMETFPSILGMITIQRIPVVLRGELVEAIQTYFPYDIIPNEYYDYQRLTLSYLTKMNMIDYAGVRHSKLACDPALVKDHFSVSTKEEIEYLVEHLYNDNLTKFKLLTFEVLWPVHTNVSISNGTSKEVETVFCDAKEEHEAIVSSLKKVFEHNAKHDKYKSGDKPYYGEEISALRCYDERIADTKLVQAILDMSIVIDDNYYGFDAENKAYVRFECTGGNVYHGFEIKPTDELKVKLDKVFNNG